MNFASGAQGRVAAGEVVLGFEWWPGAGPVVCLHGLTSHRRAFRALADELSPAVGLLALDLRGRGESDQPAGPYGIEVHAADVVAALDTIGLHEPVILAGHSMGAFVVAAICAKNPERVRAAILLDGGDYRAPVGVDPAEHMTATLGTVIARLDRTFASADEVCELFETTPLYEGRMDDAAREYFAFDVAGPPGALRTRAYKPGVEFDWAELVTNAALRENLARIAAPALLVTAPGGLTGTGDAVITAEIEADMRRWIPRLTVARLEGENHHTFLTTRAGARRTAAVVEPFVHSILIGEVS